MALYKYAYYYSYYYYHIKTKKIANILLPVTTIMRQNSG